MPLGDRPFTCFWESVNLSSKQSAVGISPSNLQLEFRLLGGWGLLRVVEEEIVMEASSHQIEFSEPSCGHHLHISHSCRLLKGLGGC